MADFPVKCWCCGATGLTPNFIGGDGSGTVHLSGNIMVNACPKCGGDMQIVDGSYDLSGGVVTAFRALGRDELERMRDVLASTRSGAIDPAQATRTVAAISPDVAALIEAMENQRQWTAPVIVNTLLAVIAVLLAWLALNPHHTLSEADHDALQHDIGVAIERAAPASPAIHVHSPKTTPADTHTPGSRHGDPKRKKRPPKTYGASKTKKKRR